MWKLPKPTSVAPSSPEESPSLRASGSLVTNRIQVLGIFFCSLSFSLSFSSILPSLVHDFSSFSFTSSPFFPILTYSRVAGLCRSSETELFSSTFLEHPFFSTRSSYAISRIHRSPSYRFPSFQPYPGQHGPFSLSRFNVLFFCFPAISLPPPPSVGIACRHIVERFIIRPFHLGHRSA